jgi:hypothetical protein
MRRRGHGNMGESAGYKLRRLPFAFLCPDRDWLMLAAGRSN